MINTDHMEKNKSWFLTLAMDKSQIFANLLWKSHRSSSWESLPLHQQWDNAKQHWCENAELVTGVIHAARWLGLAGQWSWCKCRPLTRHSVFQLWNVNATPCGRQNDVSDAHTLIPGNQWICMLHSKKDFADFKRGRLSGITQVGSV